MLGRCKYNFFYCHHYYYLFINFFFAYTPDVELYYSESTMRHSKDRSRVLFFLIFPLLHSFLYPSTTAVGDAKITGTACAADKNKFCVAWRVCQTHNILFHHGGQRATVPVAVRCTIRCPTVQYIFIRCLYGAYYYYRY